MGVGTEHEQGDNESQRGSGREKYLQVSCECFERKLLQWLPAEIHSDAVVSVCNVKGLTRSYLVVGGAASGNQKSDGFFVDGFCCGATAVAAVEVLLIGAATTPGVEETAGVLAEIPADCEGCELLLCAAASPVELNWDEDTRLGTAFNETADAELAGDGDEAQVASAGAGGGARLKSGGKRDISNSRTASMPLESTAALMMRRGLPWDVDRAIRDGEQNPNTRRTEAL
jgi:hypothetical protein